MLYLHCDGDMVAKGGFFDLYYKAGETNKRKQLLHVGRQLKMDSENVLESIKLDEILFKKLKSQGVKTIQEGIHSGLVHPTVVLFDQFEDHLAYWRIRRRVTFFLAKCFECLVKRNFNLYILFKEALMADWPEMLDLSPTDQTAVKTGERMMIYYNLLRKTESSYATLDFRLMKLIF
jgi:hypothetical protein